ncbi:MAG: AMP-binding protein [Gammaproteobacteria bacterium]|nr:AMP-binding protein [Gammaproteobacteria bacterium]MBT4145390.1 AMP-binding protein [Gammaproteobacteria bacterium]MBT5221579.1 AMP-binding protein [Gammaproteobacteria bacterium]MBT5824787.1 AMP-binding protein [Gammaproteobacteria bacterium]MBT6420840.1 AMP-binding protein [Gammaproteobacteria bacterium]
MSGLSLDFDAEMGEPLGFDQIGELLLCGPQVMMGYLNNPQATGGAINSEA